VPFVFVDQTPRPGFPNTGWQVDASGRVKSFNDAPLFGDIRTLTGAYFNAGVKRITGIDATPDGNGYFLVTGNGSVYSFGTAPKVKGLPELELASVSPIVEIRPGGNASSWVLIAADGTSFPTTIA
jgi:hypothetical protein